MTGPEIVNRDKSVELIGGTSEMKLDVYDPLYLHANDTSGTPLVGFKLVGTENYKVWSAAVKLALHTKNKLGFITGNCKKTTSDGQLADQWERCNSVVLSWILGCVSEELYLGQIFSKNAKIVWDELEETYNKEDGSVIFNLHYKIHSLTQSGSTLSEYYHKFNSLWRQFESLVNLPDCTCDSSTEMKKHNNLLRLMQFLMGLDDVYTPVRSHILTTDPLPDVRTAFALLSRDESHRSSHVGSTSTKSTPAAFISKTNTWSNNKFNQGRNRL